MSLPFHDPETSIIYWISKSELTNYKDATQIIQSDKEILTSKINYSLTDCELKALFFYTADGAQSLNPFTQSKHDAFGAVHLANMSVVSNILKSALKKMPPHEGIVYRHDDFYGYEDFLKVHKIGEIVQYSSFLSTSKYIDCYHPCKVQLNIKSHSGRDMSWISLSKFYNENEEEILFAPITKFLVVNRTEKDDRIFIDLLEIT